MQMGWKSREVGYGMFFQKLWVVGDLRCCIFITKFFDKFHGAIK